MVPYTRAVWTSYSCHGNVSNEILEFSMFKKSQMSYKGDLFAFHFLCERQKKPMPMTLLDKICQTKNTQSQSFFHYFFLNFAVCKKKFSLFIHLFVSVFVFFSESTQ